MILRNLLCLIFCIFVLSLHSSSQTEFSQERAYQLLKYLSVDIGPRPMGSPAEQEALRFAVEKFREYGCDTAYIMPIDRYSDGNTSSGIAVGIKKGISKKIIVIGGHIDSSDPEIPGANDDGSGVAVVLEAARVLAKSKHNSTIVFCCFGGEEKGLVGSRHFVADFAEIDSVNLMLQVDMTDGRGPLDIDPDAHRSSSAPRWLVDAAVEEYTKLGYTNLRYPTHFFSLNHAVRDGPGSDHEPFLQKGIPSIAFISDVSYPVHTAQDNFENFDPVGLKRSGDIVLKLFEKFDQGIPSRNLEKYWLYLLAGIPVFIPLWGLWVFAILTIIITVIAFVQVRKQRESPDTQPKIRWSGLKLFLFSLIVVACGWFSSDFVGLIKNVRHPWISSSGVYYVLSLTGMLIGVWITLRLNTKIKLSRCPYFYFKRSIIILIVLLGFAGFLNIKFVVEPSIGLLLISIAMLVRNPILKIISLVLSPVWMLRLIFSEWSEIFFHEIAKVQIPGIGLWLLANTGVIVLLTIYIFPFVFAAAAVIRNSASIQNILRKMRSRYVFGALAVCFIGLTAFAVSSPSFNNLWKREIKINQECNFDTQLSKISIESSEYLNGIKISAGGHDTLITTNVTSLILDSGKYFDSNWVKIERKIEKQQSDTISHYDLELSITTASRPFTISIAYSINGKEMNAFDTPFQFRTNRKQEKQISWFSFPDTLLIIPVKFSAASSDTVQEKIEITFNKLVTPMKITGEMIYIVPRTKFISSYLYLK
jgi:hypothetical protein